MGFSPIVVSCPKFLPNMTADDVHLSGFPALLRGKIMVNLQI